MPFVQNQNLTCLNQPQNGKVLITNADALLLNVVYVAGPNGSKIAGGILAQSTDTAAHDIQLGINNGGTINAPLAQISGGQSFPISTGLVPIGAGNSSAVPVANIMPPSVAQDSDGQPYILLAIGDVLYAQALVAVTSGKQITISALNVADF
jgi:hypothetical protein